MTKRTYTDAEIDFLRIAIPGLPEKYLHCREQAITGSDLDADNELPAADAAPETEYDGIRITAEHLMHICPSLKPDRANHLSHVFTAVLSQYPDLQDYEVLHELMAQGAKESREFSVKDENLYYTTPKRLMQVFPSYIKTTEQAKQYVRNPEKLGNLVYSNRNGNGAGEGYRFRGGTFAMITFKPTWTAWAVWNGFDLDQALSVGRTDDGYAFDALCWFFSVYKSLTGLALQNRFEELSRRYAGSKIGYADRLVYYGRAKEIMK